MVCLQFEPIYKRTFDNGLVLVSEKVPRTERVEINIGIKVGSAYELPEEEGAAHFLEHLMWKRETRKESNKRGLAVDGNGIYLNAETGHDITNLIITAPKNKLEIIFDTIKKDFQNYQIVQREFDSEKDIVLNEIKAEFDDCDLFGNNLLNERIFRGTPLEKPELGRYDSVAALTQDNIFSFKRKWYVPNNAIVSVVGNFDEKELTDIVAKTLGSLQYSVLSKPSIVLPRFKKSIYAVPVEGLELTHVYVGFKPSKVDSFVQDYLDLIDKILDLGECSLLRQEFREKNGLSYSVDTSVYNFFEDVCYFYFKLASEPRKTKKLEDKLFKLFDLLKEGKFSKIRFQHAKNLWKTELDEEKFEKLKERAEALVKSEVSGDERDYRELPQRIDAMTYEQTREYAKEFFSKPYVMVKLVPE